MVTVPEVIPAKPIVPVEAPAVPRSSKAPGVVVPIPTRPALSIINGEVSPSPVSSLTRKLSAAPKLVTTNGVAVEVANVAAFKIN